MAPTSVQGASRRRAPSQAAAASGQAAPKAHDGASKGAAAYMLPAPFKHSDLHCILPPPPVQPRARACSSAPPPRACPCGANAACARSPWLTQRRRAQRRSAGRARSVLAVAPFCYACNHGSAVYCLWPQVAAAKALPVAVLPGALACGCTSSWRCCCSAPFAPHKQTNNVLYD